MAQGPRRPFGPCWGSRSYDVEYVFSSEAGLVQTRAVTKIIFGFCNRNGYVSEQHAARLCGYMAAHGRHGKPKCAHFVDTHAVVTEDLHFL